MKTPPLPHDELQRLKKLHSLHILDTPPEERFDRITRTAQRLFNVPMAIISLVDDTRQWFKSCQGLQATETSRDISFCAHAILDDDILYIRDAAADDRFADNPVVTGPPFVRFYAGAPLKSEEGHALGTLCIIDSQPHIFEAADFQALRDLANIVQEEINHAKFNRALATIRNYEISLREETARYQELVTQLSEIVFQVNTENRWVFLNPAWEKITDFAVAETLGQNCFDFIHDDDKKRVETLLDTLRMNKIDCGHCEARWHTQTTGQRWFRLFAKQSKSMGNTYISGTLTDITEEKRRWEYTLNNQLRLEVVNTISSGLLRCNTASASIDYTLKQLAKRVPEIYCFYATIDSAGNVQLLNHIGPQLCILNATLNLQQYAEILRELKNGQLVRCDESHRSTELQVFKHINPDVKAVLAAPIHENNNDLKLLILLATHSRTWSYEIELLIEISYLLSATLNRVVAEEEQALALKKLSEMSSRLESFIANHRYGVLIENANSKVVIINHALCRHFDIVVDGKDFSGCDSADIWHLAKVDFTRPDVYLDTIRAHSQSREPIFDYIIETRNGIIFERDYIPVWSGNTFLGGIWQYRDITERKKIERMKNEFISMVSHELRTPLTSIRGSLGLLNGGVAGVLSEQAQSLVSIANKNTERLLHLINDILDVEKIEAGKIDYKFCRIDLMPLLQQAVDINQAYAAQNQVTICLNQKTPDLCISTDPDRLLQVLANLLSNASKFSPPSSTVKIIVEANASQIMISIHDQGPGIPLEFHERIFQKFAQADSSDRRYKSGTGLGLNIAKAVTEGLGGQLSFTSTPGNTVFCLNLPIQPV